MSRKPMERLRAEAAFLIALVKSPLAASFALRAAFWLSAGFMILNNFLFFSTWWILMERFGQVRGWQLADVMCLFAVAAAGFGLCVITCGGLTVVSLSTLPWLVVAVLCSFITFTACGVLMHSFALWAFSRGLRRYASGNRFSVRA